MPSRSHREMDTLDDQTTCCVSEETIVIIYLLQEQNVTHTVRTVLTWEVPQNECFCSVSQSPSSQHQKERSWISADQLQHISVYSSCFWYCCYITWFQYQQTWKFSLMWTGLKLFGMTTTPLCTLNLKATWAVVLLYFLASDTSSSSSNNGGHFRFTLWKWLIFY